MANTSVIAARARNASRQPKCSASTALKNRERNPPNTLAAV